METSFQEHMPYTPPLPHTQNSIGHSFKKLWYVVIKLHSESEFSIHLVHPFGMGCDSCGY